jgi:hypothetical protein
MFDCLSGRPFTIILGALVALLVLTACGQGVAAPPPAGTPFARRPNLARPTSTVPTILPGTPTPANISPYTTVRTYMDARNRTITLYHGRAVGRRGDWGWAHIVGKHLYGQWADGGPVTTFDIVGVTTPEGVQTMIGRVLKEGRTRDVANGRREYRLAVNSRYEVLTVVGSDGAVITAYPDGARG